AITSFSRHLNLLLNKFYLNRKTTLFTYHLLFQVLNEEMIKQIQDQAKNAHKEGFVPTQEVHLEEQPVTFKNVSSQLPLKKSF
ncbi:MAG: hypothetical protein U9532_02060, partial ['Conium maculatum' witches'-broom phytoplasma]|nr:hypothetical protein ['Conium maculatum' witches'-broom phytoplasma]